MTRTFSPGSGSPRDPERLCDWARVQQRGWLAISSEVIRPRTSAASGMSAFPFSGTSVLGAVVGDGAEPVQEWCVREDRVVEDRRRGGRVAHEWVERQRLDGRVAVTGHRRPYGQLLLVGAGPQDR